MRPEKRAIPGFDHPVCTVAAQYSHLHPHLFVSGLYSVSPLFPPHSVFSLYKRCCFLVYLVCFLPFARISSALQFCLF